MAEISVVSALLTPIVALAPTESLDEFLDKLPTHKQPIRELRQEVKALRAVLQSLYNVIEMANLPNLEIPNSIATLLNQCGKVCYGFKKVVNDAITDTSQPMRVNDWVQVNYLGITQFKNMLAGYRSTLVIIYLSAVFRTAAVTDNVLRGYQEMIRNTISDLEEHLDIQTEVLRLEKRGVFEAAYEITEEKKCSQQCRAICARVLDYVDNVQSKTIHDIFATENASQVLVCTPEDTTTQIYQDNLGKLKITVTNGNLTSAEQVVNELKGKQSIGQIFDGLTMRFAVILSTMQEGRDELKEILRTHLLN